MLTRIVASLTMLIAVLAGGPAEAKAGPVVAVGDSIVYGVGTSDPATMSWPARNGYVKVGQSGGCVVAQNCFGQQPMIEKFDEAVLSKNPSVVVIAYGINDIAAGTVSAAAIVDGLANLMWRARATGARAYVTTLTPVGPNVWFLDEARRDVNARIRARFVNVIDTEAPLINRNNGMLRWVYDSGDNLHPNYDGYTQIAAAVRSSVG